MRVSLVALCSLTVCTIQEYANPPHAQALTEATTPEVDTPTSSIPDVVELATASLAPPEGSTPLLFSQAAQFTVQHADVTASKVREHQTLASASNLAPAHCSNVNQGVITRAHALSTSITSELTSGSTASRELEQALVLENCVTYTTDESAPENPVVSEETVAVLDRSLEFETTQDSLDSEHVLASLDTEGSQSELEPGATVTSRPISEDITLSPLERPPTRLFNLETANQLSAGSIQLSTGFHQTISSDVDGTGNQLYYGAVEWGINDDLQIAFTGEFYDDPPAQAIDGELPDITWLSLAPSIKYRLVNEEHFSLGVQGSVELLSLSSSLLDTDDSDERVIGSLHLPMTYTMSPKFQFHLTPGVAFFPASINDVEFYDTVFLLGGGFSWQPSERWLVFSTLNLPLGPGGNTIDDDQSIDRQLVWTVGTRYTVTPKVGVDLYGTNGFGVTPATGILSFIPEGDEPLIGLRLNYTPDLGSGYRSSFRQTQPVPLSERDRHLLIDGFTLTTANTLEPGTVALTGGFGTNDSYNVSVAYSPDQELQIEAALDQFGSDDDVSLDDSAGDNLKYMLGVRIRLLNQFQGDPLSLGVRILGGRDTGERNQIGILFAEVPVTYQVNSRAALFFNPRLAAFSDTVRFGVGLGLNYEIARGLQLIGEVTPVVDDEPTVWAVGTRYQVPRSSISLELYATNAIGRNGLGNLAGESGARLGFNINWVIGDR